MSIQKIKGGTYVDMEYMGANVSCVDTGEGLVLIDTPHIPDEIRQWKEATDRLRKSGIAYVINTHHHFDHCLGNKFYSPNVIAHQLCYEEMAKPDGTMRHYFISNRDELTDEVKKQIYEIPISLPRITFSEHMWVHIGDTSLKLIHTGGHTRSSIFIYLAGDKILFTGDNVVAGSHPYKGQAEFRQWMKALESIKGMDIDLVVPGHGGICEKGEIGRMLEYLQRLWNRVLKLREEGLDREAVIQQAHELIECYPLEPELASQQIKWFDEGLARIYDEIEGKSGMP